jgi:hypothetical protein
VRARQAEKLSSETAALAIERAGQQVSIVVDGENLPVKRLHQSHSNPVTATSLSVLTWYLASSQTGIKTAIDVRAQPINIATTASGTATARLALEVEISEESYPSPQRRGTS